jgi:hypothetical protein
MGEWACKDKEGWSGCRGGSQWSAETGRMSDVRVRQQEQCDMASASTDTGMEVLHCTTDVERGDEGCGHGMGWVGG